MSRPGDHHTAGVTRDWAAFLVPILRERADLDDVQGRALALGALSCFDAALETWVEREGAEPLDGLLDRTFRAVGYR